MRYLSLVLFAGCFILKASSPETTDFVPYPYKLTARDPRFPFAATWIGDRQTKSSSLYIRPVYLGVATEKVKQRSVSEREAQERTEELEEIARYMKVRFEMAISNYKDHPVKIGDETSDQVLELAITDIIPTDPIINTIGTAAGVFVPGGGVVKALGTGEISIEGILRNNKKVVMQFKDREIDKLSALPVKDFQQYAHIRQAIDDWAEQYATIMVDPWKSMVDESLPVSLY